jgi:opacity protein-like surface antigen
VLQDVSPYSGPTPVETKYRLQGGYQLALGVDWNITDQIALAGEVSYMSTSYQKVQSRRFGLDIEEFTDRQKWIRAPISVKYMDKVGQFRPYGMLGYSLNLLTADKGEIVIKNQNKSANPGESNTITEAQSPTLNFTDQRRFLTHSFFVGGGVRYKWKLDYLFAEMRYSFGMNRITDEKKIFDSPNVYQYGHVDDYFRMDHLSVSVGFIRPLYKPRKLKKARTRGLLNMLKKKKNEEPQN